MRNLFKLKNNESQRGVAAVEFAIVLPLLLFLFIGITEFGIAYYNKQVLTNASREGARAGIVAGTPNNEIQQITFDYADPRLIPSGNFSIGNITPVRSGEYLTVTVTFQYTYLILAGFNFFGANFGNVLTISAQTVIESL